jgi:hypothetical protein
MALAKISQNHVRNEGRVARILGGALLMGAGFLAGCSTEAPSSGTGGSPGCVQTELCETTAHWDPIACSCVPNAVDAGAAGSSGAAGGSAGAFCSGDVDCQGPLPQLCQLCSDGKSACAHHECVVGHCEIVICPSASPGSSLAP